jgi:hypothetical protein
MVSDRKDLLKRIVEKGLKDYRVKPVKMSGKNYNLHVFFEDEDLNLFEGFLFAEPEEKSELSYLISRYRAPVSGYVPRLSLLFYNDQLIIKDYRKNKYIRKTLRKINKTFITKLKKALNEPTEISFKKLFDRTDIIEEFYILYKKAREYLLENVKGISEEDRRVEFVDNFMMQLLTLWFLQEKGFFDRDISYFITKFKDLEQKKLSGGFDSYYQFLTYFFERIKDGDTLYYEDATVGDVVIVGPAIFLNSGDKSAVTIPDKCFYKDGTTDVLVTTAPKKVSQDVPLFNLFESRDWVEGDIDEFVLGALYEKLMTEDVRKRTGSYYTPEEITSYICKNTIEPYLVDRVNETFSTNFESTDQIIESSDKEILRYLFEQLKEIKVLDPAVGSAHFLECAINVLLSIYEKIWEKAKDLGLRSGLEIVAADEQGNIKPITILEIGDPEHLRMIVKFFIILSRNVYGVDINPGAINVAKARLFLTIARHFKAGRYFIRFPNVHFNLRTGNSLIGYAKNGEEKEEVKAEKGQLSLDFFIKEKEATYIVEAIKVVSELTSYLVDTARTLGIRGDTLKEVEELNTILSKEEITWSNFEKVLRTKEKLIRVFIASLNSQYARPLNELLNKITELFNGKLDEKFAEEHDIKHGDLEENKTFHWIFEFPEVFLDRGGFDVVVGNPPYVELNEIEYGYLLTESKNLYDAFIKTSVNMLISHGRFGFIHANSAYCQPKYKALRSFLKENTDDLIIINFAIRPQPIFKGVMQRTAITICKKDNGGAKIVKTSRYIRLTEKNRNEILSHPSIYNSSLFAWNFEEFVPKIGNEFDYCIFKKLFENAKNVEDILDKKSGSSVFYHDSGESYWTKALIYEPKGIREGKEVRPSHWFSIMVNPIYADFVLCAINSTLFYWFWLAASDCRDLTQNVLRQFPIPYDSAFSSRILKELKESSIKLMNCYQKNSYYVEKRAGYKSLEFKVNRCKWVVNEIDRLMGQIYGLTDEEVEYLIKYDEVMRTEES